MFVVVYNFHAVPTKLRHHVRITVVVGTALSTETTQK